MKKLQIAVLFCIGFNAIAYTQQIPAINLTDINGKVLNTGSFNTDNKIIILAFWATWCIPCINELSAINDKLSDWKKENQVDFYAVSEDDSRTIKRVKPLVNGKNWDFNVLLDNNQDLKRSLDLMNIPYTIIIKNGKIIYRHAGYVEGEEDILLRSIKENQ